MEYVIFIVITSIASIMAGMGIGGGAVFIALTTILNLFEQKEAQLLNLILFIMVGFGASYTNVKNKLINKEIVKKMLPLMALGTLIGTYFVNKVDNDNLKIYFNIFLVIIGIYEIISSLIKLKSTQTNNET